MHKRFVVLAALLGIVPAALLLIFASPPGADRPAARAQAPWTNGQDALYVLGQADFSSSTSGVSATQFSAPKDVAIDRLHNKLYVLDSFNNRVLRFSYPINASQPAAELVFGQPDFTSFGSGTSRSQFNGPRGLAVDDSGRLWVSEYSNNRVVWFNDAHLVSSNQPEADGVLGQPDFTSSAPATSQNGLRNPYGLGVTTEGTLYVADASNHRVLRFDQAASKANGAPADGVLGQPDFTSGAPGLTQTSLDTPRGVAVYGTTLFVAERGNARVLRFDQAASKADGAPADGVLGQPDFTSEVQSISQAGMEYPSRLAVDGAGRLYVSDGFNADRVVVFTNAAEKADGAPADYVLGQPDFTSSGAALAQNRLNMDSSGGGLAVDSFTGLLFVADDNNNRVMVFQAEEPLIYPQLEISKSGPSSAVSGSPITYTLAVTNNGTLAATNLTLTDTLPAGATYLGGGSLSGSGVVSWTLPSLGIGASDQVQFSVTASQTITNSDYGVTSAEGAAAQGVQAVVTDFYFLPELSISKSGPAVVLAGSPITYTLMVTNSGLGEATDLVITDTLPAGATYLSGGELLPGGVVRWTMPGLGAGLTEQVQFAVAAAQTITNSQYGVTSAEGVSADGDQEVVTEVYWQLTLPMIVRAVQPTR